MFGGLFHTNANAPVLSPAPFDPGGTAVGYEVVHTFGPDILLLTCAMLLLLMIASMVAVYLSRREAQFIAGLARTRALRLEQLMRTVSLAEEISGLGIWQYDPATGTQQWSNGLRRLFGVAGTAPFVDGDVETLLFANNVDLTGAVNERLAEQEPYALRFDIYGFDGCPRSLCVEACNLRDRHGKPARVVAVVSDVTEQIEHVRELEFSRAAAVREATAARQLADTDPLTGLANRRRMMRQLDNLIVGARRSKQDLALIVFDIDHFKSVNDTYGHLEGDRMLKEIARLAQYQARDGDVIARVGGEEFVWIVPAANETAVRAMSERLRKCVANESGTDKVPAVTISAGIASLMAGDTSLSLFARADSALYEAKNSGRNRVSLAA
ncbi:diguanylate cyclase [Erythrobacter sp. MTPC3]|uniref:GGDEF domain-containing protein n=1 Tax=Erythrobacter sp. MTPC3 TaxID=3056564 RepID=UPI0036F303CF